MPGGKRLRRRLGFRIRLQQVGFAEQRGFSLFINCNHIFLPAQPDPTRLPDSFHVNVSNFTPIHVLLARLFSLRFLSNFGLSVLLFGCSSSACIRICRQRTSECERSNAFFRLKRLNRPIRVCFPYRSVAGLMAVTKTTR